MHDGRQRVGALARWLAAAAALGVLAMVVLHPVRQDGAPAVRGRAGVPIVEADAAAYVAEHEPWRVEAHDADAVYAQAPVDVSVPQPALSAGGWQPPAEHGGSMLDLAGNGFREPINVIISGHSHPSVLSERGLLDFARSIGFSFECLHIHLGGLQRANLGDGQGYVPQLFEYRSLLYPRAPGAWVGACWESLAGGNHFRGMRMH